MKDIFNDYGDYSKGKASQISTKNLVVVVYIQIKNYQSWFFHVFYAKSAVISKV